MPQRLVIIGAAPVAVVLIILFFEYTHVGKAMRAVTAQKDGAHANGWGAVFFFADALKRSKADLNDLVKARTQVRDAMETAKGIVGSMMMGDMTKWHEILAPLIPTVVKSGALVPIGKKFSPTWANVESGSK